MCELRVIADTSFLMLPGSFGIDIFAELDRLLERRYKLIAPSSVARELKRLAKSGTPSERTAANLGLTFAKELIELGDHADEEILKLASEGNCVVGTTDSALRKELRRLGVPVVYLRGKSHLAIEGWIK